MVIVGIHNTGTNSSAAIFVDGELVFATQEERVTRQKYDRFFPHKSIQHGLSHSGLTIDDVDTFAIAWNPAINISNRTRAGFSDWPSYPGYRYSSNPNNILPRLKISPNQHSEQIFFSEKEIARKISYISHHHCHAAFSFFSSPFESAAIFSSDGYGERAASAWFIADGEDIKLLGTIDFPHSHGMFYSTMTEFLGFRPHFDEWKVMGAAAYGDSDKYLDKIRRLFRHSEGLDVKLDLEYFNFYDFDARHTFSQSIIELLGPFRCQDEKVNSRHFDLAAATQRVFEENLISAGAQLQKITKVKNICLSGGTAMNCKANGVLSDSKIFEHVYVPFAPDDPGNAIGAGVCEIMRCGGRLKRKSLSVPYLGRGYEFSEVETLLETSKINFTKPRKVHRVAADLIANGKIIAWFQGRSEFGQRALGNRSILADPRDENIKRKVNESVKFREGFRPFAPAILEQYVGDWFQNPQSSVYMEKTLLFRTCKMDLVPGVVHADGTGRLQTVSVSSNPMFHQLIMEFYKITKVPILLNTSLNLNHEPIVDTPLDAIRTFYSSGLDAIVIENCLVEK